MLSYIFRRLLQAVPLLAIVSMVAFGLAAAAPGNAAVSLLASRGVVQGASGAESARIAHNLGADQPAPVQYLHWLGNLLHGQLGYSAIQARPVATVIGDALGPTLLLVGTSLVLSFVLSIALGLVRGLYPGSIAARMIGALVILLYSAPSFLVALGLIVLFSVTWPLLPSSGMHNVLGSGPGWLDEVRHLILPALALTLGHHVAVNTRLVETGVVDALASEHVRFARAKGLPRLVILHRHVLRGALTPFIVSAGLSLPGLLGGAYVIEFIFAWPGLGTVGLQAAQSHDYGVLVSLILLTGVLVVAGNLLADLAVAVLDPRIRLSGPAPVSEAELVVEVHVYA